MYFSKQDLAKKKYLWIETNAGIYTGDPSRRSFDKHNGFQVLFIINACSLYTENFSSGLGRMIEQKLHEFLPGDIKSEIAVLNWIKNNVIG